MKFSYGFKLLNFIGLLAISFGLSEAVAQNYPQPMPTSSGMGSYPMAASTYGSVPTMIGQSFLNMGGTGANFGTDSGTGGSNNSYTNNNTNSNNKTSLGNIFKQWFIYGVTGGACDTKEQLADKEAKAPALLADLDAKLVYAEKGIAYLNQSLQTPNLDYQRHMELVAKLADFEDYKRRVLERIGMIKGELALLRQNLEGQKQSFVILCSSGFVGQCMEKASAFMTPNHEAVKRQGKSFCENQFESILGWQCPYRKALSICEQNYNAAKNSCEGIQSPLQRTACLLGAYGDKIRCEKNPPGYPGAPGTPTGIPDEDAKYQSMFNAAIPACLWALASN